MFKKWCGRRDSNPYALQRQIFLPLRLSTPARSSEVRLLSTGLSVVAVRGLDCVFTVEMNSYRWAGMTHLPITFFAHPLL